MEKMIEIINGIVLQVMSRAKLAVFFVVPLRDKGSWKKIITNNNKKPQSCPLSKKMDCRIVLQSQYS